MKIQLTKTKHINGPKIIKEVEIVTKPLQHTHKTSFLIIQIQEKV